MAALEDGPRLALVSQNLSGLSGKVILVLENVPRLRRAGFAVDIVAQRIDAGRFREAGARVHKILSLPVGRVARTSWFARRAAERVRGNCDLVVAHGEGLRDADVLHVHNCLHHGAYGPGGESYAARLQARTLCERRFRLLIVNSELARAELCGRYGLPRDLVEVVYPGHDPRRFRPDPADARARTLRAQLSAELVVGLITSGDFEKRAVGPFLEALALLPASLRARLGALVVGKEKHLGRYLELARRTGLGERMRFLPPQAEVETLYRSLDLYVHPAHFEEFGMSVLEAFACGVPVLTGKCVGAAELVSGEVQRYLLDVIEPEPMAERMRELLEDERARVGLAQAGRAASLRWTWDENVARHLACYGRLSATSASTPR